MHLHMLMHMQTYLVCIQTYHLSHTHTLSLSLSLYLSLSLSLSHHCPDIASETHGVL
jgi:hypothetical protein